MARKTRKPARAYKPARKTRKPASRRKSGKQIIADAWNAVECAMDWTMACLDDMPELLAEAEAEEEEARRAYKLAVATHGANIPPALRAAAIAKFAA